MKKTISKVIIIVFLLTSSFETTAAAYSWQNVINFIKNRSTVTKVGCALGVTGLVGYGAYRYYNYTQPDVRPKIAIKHKSFEQKPISMANTETLITYLTTPEYDQLGRYTLLDTMGKFEKLINNTTDIYINEQIKTQDGRYISAYGFAVMHSYLYLNTLDKKEYQLHPNREVVATINGDTYSALGLAIKYPSKDKLSGKPCFTVFEYLLRNYDLKTSAVVKKQDGTTVSAKDFLRECHKEKIAVTVENIMRTVLQDKEKGKSKY